MKAYLESLIKRICLLFKGVFNWESGVNRSLYRLEKSQKFFLNFLGVLFLFLSIVWAIIDYFKYDFPIEPITVFVGGLATLFASYWPFRAKYRSSGFKGRDRFDYTTNDGNYNIGNGDSEFVLRFSGCSDEEIYLYAGYGDVESVAVVEGCGKISEIADASSSDLKFNRHCISLKEGGVAVLKRRNGLYCALRVVDVRKPGHCEGDRIHEVVFEYVINSDGGVSFRGA